MKLTGKFYSTLEEAKQEKKTYLSTIPVFEEVPKIIYATMYYDEPYIILENKNNELRYVAPNSIKTINERLNFTQCTDTKIKLYNVCNIKNAIMFCKFSDIKTIEATINDDATMMLLLTLKNDSVIDCTKIENLK